MNNTEYSDIYASLIKVHEICKASDLCRNCPFSITGKLTTSCVFDGNSWDSIPPSDWCIDIIKEKYRGGI